LRKKQSAASRSLHDLETRHNSIRRLVVLGSKFGAGQEGDVAKHFRDLEVWTRRNLEVGDIAWRWVNEDYDYR
jgi:hypothetical protein